MDGNFPFFLFLSVATLAVFSFIGVMVWSTSRRREREAFYRSEMVKKIADTQGAGGTAALEFMREQEKNDTRRDREKRKLAGLITAAVGMGLMVFLRNLVSDAPVYLVGLIPLFVGIVLLASSFLFAPKE